MNNISKLIGISGVYCIENTKTGELYIGSSRNVGNRLYKHRAILRANIHPNRLIQDSYNNHGELNFTFRILCECASLLEEEQRFIDELKPSLNISSSVYNTLSNPESRELLSKSRKAGIENGSIKKNCLKKCYKYSLNGDFIEEYESIAEACKANNIEYKSIRRCVTGEYKTGGGFVWSMEKFDKIESPDLTIKRPKAQKRIKVYNNNEYFEFNCAEECAKFFNAHIVSVRDSILKNRKFKRKYMIEYIVAAHLG